MSVDGPEPDSAVATAVAGVAMRVPEPWYELDVHPASRDESISRLVRERARRHPELEPRRADIVRVLRRVARQAGDRGAIYCGGMAEVLGGIPLSASIMIQIIRARSDDGAPLDNDPAAVAASLRARPAGPAAATWREVTVVELPRAGRAARAHGVEDVELPGEAAPVRLVTMQTFVPMPAADGVALIAGASPVLDLAASFHDVFDAITSTFRFVSR